MESKQGFSEKWFERKQILEHTEQTHGNTFCSKLNNSIVLERHLNMYIYLHRKGMTSRLLISSTWKETKTINIKVGKKSGNRIKSFQDSLKWYNNEDVVDIVAALLKMITNILYRGEVVFLNSRANEILVKSWTKQIGF